MANTLFSRYRCSTVDSAQPAAVACTVPAAPGKESHGCRLIPTNGNPFTGVECLAMVAVTPAVRKKACPL